MTRRTSRAAQASLLATILLCPAVRAQAPAPQQQAKAQIPPKIAVRVELVNVDVTVTDAQGHFVSDLKRENFRLLDEGVPQPITHFAPVEAPAQVLVLVETSPAVYLIHRQHLQAAYALLEGLAVDDWVALGTYDQSVRLAPNWTQDKRALAQALGSLQYSLGMAELNLYDGIAAALAWLEPLPGKKAIVLLTTGLDTSSSRRWETLLQELRGSEVVVLPVALGGELREPNKKKKGAPAPRATPAERDAGLSFEQADRALEAIAQATGGHAFFPRDACDFAGIYRQIAALLRHQYSLGFVPPARDSRFHRIEIQLQDASGRPLVGKDGSPLYRIRARHGYIAPVP